MPTSEVSRASKTAWISAADSHVAAGVEVEHGVEAALAGCLAGPMEVVDEDAEALLGQGRLGVRRDLAGPAHALRLDRRVGQHGLGHDVVRPAGGQQVEDADHPLAVLGGVLRAAEALGQEGAHQREATSGEARPELLRVAEVAGRSELGAGIAGRRHLVQHLLRLAAAAGHPRSSRRPPTSTGLPRP